MVQLFGKVSSRTTPLQVYTDGACIGNGTSDAQAGAGIFWGIHSVKNRSLRVPGKQTNNRGEIYAILKAIEIAPKESTLKIYTDSMYAIKSIGEWAIASAARGWEIENGDLISDCVDLIRQRTGRLSLIQVKGHSGNKHNDAADALAKEGA
ncbi:ribonuclease H-like domain-containing protein, partial [Pholiota molesta]